MALTSVQIFFPNKSIQGFRGLHYIEGGREIPWTMPGVIPPIDQERLEMTSAIQWMSFNLMRAFNPAVTGKIWRALHKWGLCLNNEPQDGFEGGIPLRDYINEIDLKAAELPKYDKKQRTFQGSLIRGVEVSGEIHCYPGEHCIDASKPLPSIDRIIQKSWYSVAVNVGPSHNPVPSHFTQGQGGPIVYPFISDELIRFPREYFDQWNSSQLPDPTVIYGKRVL